MIPDLKRHPKNTIAKVSRRHTAALTSGIPPASRATFTQGDSGFVVVRDGAIVLRSSPKQHFFDCPLQLGAAPEYVDGTDTADDAELLSLPVLPGDVVVAGATAADVSLCVLYCVL